MGCFFSEAIKSEVSLQSATNTYTYIILYPHKKGYIRKLAQVDLGYKLITLFCSAKPVLAAYLVPYVHICSFVNQQLGNLSVAILTSNIEWGPPFL